MLLNEVGVVPDEVELARAAAQNQHLANRVEGDLATLVLRTRANNMHVRSLDHE
jgi:hypothetical protein